MGNLIMPKQSADMHEMQSVLKVYYDNNGWLENRLFIEELKQLIGNQLEPQAYTKKTQIPAYFGFITWEDLNNTQSNRKITDSGKRFYEALLANDSEKIFDELMFSLENNSFGRDVCGCDSDSSIEPPQLFIRLVLILGYLTRKEYSYVLFELNQSQDHLQGHLIYIITQISKNRKNNIDEYVTNKFNDAKPITALLNWKFFVLSQDKIMGQDKVVLNEKVLEKYLDRLYQLKIFNDLPPTPSRLNNDDSILSTKANNKIFYGAPGTGKSYHVHKLIKAQSLKTRTVTFHPDYDYASFVGGYKPTMNGDNIRYEFVPQIFINIYIDAWNNLEENYCLLIEEINRGNCAEIFGDIFQLLDRTTQYEITPSKELQEYLKISLKDNDYINEDKIVLPPNLYIYATMNTSDQSLFPMDSAFKRRWEWEYIPINYTNSDDNISSKYKVYLNETEKFSWLTFIQEVNKIIKENENLGMDKCLGNYFIYSDNCNITIEAFIHKAIFYLWNDVFKDEPDDRNIFKNKLSYEDFFPLATHGVAKVKNLLNILKIEIDD